MSASQFGTRSEAPAYGEPKRFFYATEYDFLPQGVQEIKRLFDIKLARRELEASCDYKRSTRSFIVDCAFHEFGDVYNCFHAAIGDLIGQEIPDYYEFKDGIEFVSQHIARVNYDCEQNEIVPESRYMVDEPSTIRIRWHCRSDDRELAEMLPKETQEQIEQLTGTKLVEDLNGQIIDITSPTEEAGERALRKLEILRRSYNLRRENFAMHVFFTEDKENYQLSFKSIAQFPNRVGQTTLLDSLFSTNPLFQYRFMKRICTVRYCYFEPHRSMYLLKTGGQSYPLIPDSQTGGGFQPWKDQIRLIRSKQRPFPVQAPEVQMSQPPPGEPPGNRTISNEVQEADESHSDTPDEEKVVPFSELTQTQEIVKRWLEHSPDPAEAVDLLGPVEDTHAAGHIGDGRRLLNSERPSPPRPPESLIRQYIMEGTLDEASVPSVDDNVPDEATMDTVVTAPVTPGSRSVGNVTPNPDQAQVASEHAREHDHEPDTVLDDLDDFLNPKATQAATVGSLVDDGLVDELNQPPNSPEYSPFKTNCFLMSNSDEVPRIIAGFEVLQPQKSSKNDSGHDTKNAVGITERLAVTSELDSRVYHTTMKQQASKQGSSRAVTANLVKWTPHFNAHLQLSIKHLLTRTRIERGQIKLEWQLGRALIYPHNRKVIAYGDRELSLPLEDMHDLLNNSGAAMHFTRVLTMKEADACWMVAMKDSAGEELWVHQPKCSVVYEFFCWDSFRRVAFIVVLDASTLEASVKSRPESLSTIDIHCTLRNWDSRLVATSQKDLKATCGSAAEALSQNIIVNTQEDVVSMTIKASEEYNIEAMRILRTALYPSVRYDTQLKVVEVEMPCLCRTEVGYTVTSFAEPVVEGFPTKWSESSLVSPVAQQILAENENLELGEETSWTEADFEERVKLTESMCRLGCYITTMIDGVGMDNNNGYEVDTETTTIAPSTAIQAVEPQPW